MIPAATPPSGRTSRRRAVRRLVAALVAVGVVLLLWTAWALLSARSSVHEAQAQLTGAQHGGGVDDTRARLQRARRELDRAHGRLGAPGPRLVGYLPLVGRTPRAALAGTDAARATARAGLSVLDATTTGPPLMADGRLDPAGLARVAGALRSAAKQVRGPVRRLDGVPTGWTPGTVAHGVVDARDRLDGLPGRLDAAAGAVDAIAGLTGARGDRHLLIVLENNAELRGTGGIVTVFAEATAHDGRIDLQRFRDVDDVADPAATATRVPSPADYHRLWGPYLADTTLWKNANMSPDIATSSSVLARIAATSLHRSPDAVLWLDVPLIADVIGATTPARLPDGTVLTKTSTVPQLLSAAYTTAVDTREGQRARRARLRGAADAVAARLFHGSPDVSRLGLALADAARGRHLALWSADTAEQASFTAAAVSGTVAAEDGDIASAVVQNFGGGDTDGNKLDYYARRQLGVTVRISGRTAEVEQELTLRNAAPSRGLPVYVAGKATPGTSNNYLTMAVPANAKLLSFTRGGQPVRTALFAEGDHQVLTDALSLPAGTSATWRVRYRLPLSAKGTYTLRAYPQPLAVDAGWQLRVTSEDELQTTSGRAGDVHISGPFSEQRTVTVERHRAGVVSRAAAALRRFWNQPVHLPF